MAQVTHTRENKIILVLSIAPCQYGGNAEFLISRRWRCIDSFMLSQILHHKKVSLISNDFILTPLSRSLYPLYVNHNPALEVVVCVQIGCLQHVKNLFTADLCWKILKLHEFLHVLLVMMLLFTVLSENCYT